ncbi:MAG: hypothetical protein KJI72_00560 [Patescibacteria group bacterium]|nr:hypothetical protein [Patescibacteria group bacterium]
MRIPTQDKAKNSEGGYVAVVSAIIITAIVMIIAIIFSNSNFLGRFDSQALEMKDISRKVGEGCLEYARLQIATGPYNGDETVSVGSYSCRVLPIETISNQIIIKSTASVSNRTTNLRLTIDDYTLETVLLEEVVAF